MIERLKKMKREHQVIFAVVVGFAVISFWRGVWGLLNLYLFPGNVELSFWSSIVMGLGVLVVTHYATKELV